MSVTIDDWSIAGDGVSATVTFQCRGESMGPKYKLVPFDCSDTVALVKEADGKWHLAMGNAKKPRPMQ